jgi:N-acetylneuraminic acid mutarotase
MQGEACAPGKGDVVPSEPGAWKALAPLAMGPRQETAVVELGGKIYVIGGFNLNVTVVGTVEVYDPAMDAWTAAAPLPEPLHHANAASVDGKIYVVGFLSGLGFSARGGAYVYDPGANTWSPRAAMPEGTERGGAAVAAIGSKIYVAGGFRGTSVADVSAYDTAADAWELLPPLPEARDHLVGAAVDGVFYAIGGRNGDIGKVRGEVEALDRSAGRWCSRALMPTPRGGIAAGVVGGRIIVVGGEGNPDIASGVYDDVEAYDPRTDTWAILAPMLTPRHGTAAVGLMGKLYVPGGAATQAFGAVATSEAFTP